MKLLFENETDWETARERKTQRGTARSSPSAVLFFSTLPLLSRRWSSAVHGSSAELAHSLARWSTGSMSLSASKRCVAALVPTEISGPASAANRVRACHRQHYFVQGERRATVL